MQRRHKTPRAILWASIAIVLFFGVMSFPQAASAAGEPSVTVPTTEEHIAGSATSFSVPINFDDGTHDDEIGSTSFTLDYDQACVRIDNVDADVTLVQNDLVGGFVNDADNGKLSVSIWDTGVLDNLTDGALVTVRFTLEPACRPGPSNLTDPTAAFAFVAPEPTFGTLLGASVEGIGTDGVYTLDINQAPTDISAGSLSMAENVAGLREVATLSASDSDDNPTDTLTYALSGACGGSFDNQGFSLDPADSTGLRTDRTFNYESVSSYGVCVQVIDGQGGVYMEIITLAVTNANDAPTNLTLSANTITQTAAVDDVIGYLGKADEDSGQTYTYALAAGEGDADNASFTVNGVELRAGIDTFDYAVQPEYKVRLKVTDNGSPNLSYEKQFRLLVAGASSLAVPGEPDLPVVFIGETMTVPVSLTPNGNNVLTATFQINYSESCLDYAGLTGLPSGYSNTGTDTADDGHVNISLGGGSAPLARGMIAGIVFTGTTCAATSSWTALAFDAAPTLLGEGDEVFASAKSDGKLLVLVKDTLGDCNGDASVNAADFTATALELFDSDDGEFATGSTVPSASWLWTPLGDTYNFSARGCDSNTDRLLGSGDLQCTILKAFNASYQCGGAAMASAASSAPAVISLPAAAPIDGARSASVPISLQTNGHDVAAFAATLSFDPASLVLDRTDADADGLPDAVRFHMPEGMLRLASYDAQAGRIDLVATGIVMPLPKLADGTLVTLELTAKDGVTAGGLASVALRNLSLGDSSGGNVPAVINVTAAPLAKGSLFLPAITR